MKLMIVAVWASLLMFVFFSCKKDDVPQGTETVKPVGVPTEVGIPDGSPTSKKTIDAAGGSLASNDGRIKIIVPAGALSAAQEISIQSISNKNPLGVQQAYRLLPHGVQFSKPVTIEFTYNDDDIKNSIPEALAIAYQDEKGIWQAQGGAVLEKPAKTVKITSNHFSDWSLFESFYMIASGTVVPVNGTVQLEVFTTEDLLVPLTPGEEVPLGKKVSMAASRIKEWKLAGAGNLQSNGANATYKAPSKVPGAPNPVAVSVKIDLKQRGTFLLVRHIEVAEDDGEIEVRVAGNGWVKKTASPAVRAPDGTYMIADSDGDTQGSYVLIMWQGGVGTHAYKSPYVNMGTHAHYLVTGVDNYTCSYINGADELVASGGGVTITSMGEDDGFIKGTFVVTPAGHGPNLKSTINMEGKFRVRKGW
ncbi:MAG: hypothetical protein EOO10_08430 [Chitinophagaceae bacterium]|nr:MAG: hypothetical protein EOO10_08430 [Chitinophagaceae bacterium]